MVILFKKHEYLYSDNTILILGFIISLSVIENANKRKILFTECEFITLKQDLKINVLLSH